MADEFMTGAAYLSISGFLWMVFGGIYKTSSFQDQLGFPGKTNPPAIGIPKGIGVLLADIFFAVMIIGPIVWWIVIPTAKWVVVKHRRHVKTTD